MKVVFRFADNSLVEFHCDNVRFGVTDGKDLFAITHEVVGDKVNENCNLIARHFKSIGSLYEGWHPVDTLTLLYYSEYAVDLSIEDDNPVVTHEIIGSRGNHGVVPLGNTPFEQGYSVGYNAGYASGRLS